MAKLKLNNDGWKMKRMNPKRLREGFAIMARAMAEHARKEEEKRRAAPSYMRSREIRSAMACDIL